MGVMMNDEGRVLEKRQLWLNSKHYFSICPEGGEVNHEKHQLGSRLTCFEILNGSSRVNVYVSVTPVWKYFTIP